jgi:hypothetical protein
MLHHVGYVGARAGRNPFAGALALPARGASAPLEANTYAFGMSVGDDSGGGSIWDAPPGQSWGNLGAGPSNPLPGIISPLGNGTPLDTAASAATRLVNAASAVSSDTGGGGAATVDQMKTVLILGCVLVALVVFAPELAAGARLLVRH